MFARIRRRLTYANVLMTVALVFAMSGGAYAAGKYLITSTKQISPKVLKTLVGKTGKAGPAGSAGAAGPAGPAGTAGPAGAQGPAGKDGANGVNGTPGESVSAKVVALKAKTCNEQGGTEFKVGSTTTLACNGQTGFTETLPQGKTETGQWDVSAVAAGGPEPTAVTVISFPIPLSKSGGAVYIGPEEGQGEPKEAEAIKQHLCSGTVAEPSAGEGELCLFAAEAENLFTAQPVQVFDLSALQLSSGAGKTGAGIRAISNKAGNVIVRGSWAVTAAE